MLVLFYGIAIPLTAAGIALKATHCSEPVAYLFAVTFAILSLFLTSCILRCIGSQLLPQRKSDSVTVCLFIVATAGWPAILVSAAIFLGRLVGKVIGS